MKFNYCCNAGVITARLESVESLMSRLTAAAYSDALALCREAHDSRQNTNHGPYGGDDGHFERIDGPQSHVDEIFLLLLVCSSQVQLNLYRSCCCS